MRDRYYDDYCKQRSERKRYDGEPAFSLTLNNLENAHCHTIAMFAHL
jgi:hypothetical protein